MYSYCETEQLLSLQKPTETDKRYSSNRLELNYSDKLKGNLCKKIQLHLQWTLI